MRNVKIITDSCSDLTAEQLARRDGETNEA